MNQNENNGKKDTAKRDEFWGRVLPLYEQLVHGLRDRLRQKDEDVGREALHTVLVHLAKRHPQKSFKDWQTYLATSSVNEHRHGHRNEREILFSELSKEDRKNLFAIRAPGRTPAEEAAERELWAILRREIGKLPKRQREVLTLDLLERTDEEIRAILGLKSVASVRSHRRHGIAKLRLRIPKEE